MPVEKSRPVPPFTRYCAMLIPTVFDDSMTYYEALCALSKWLQDNLVNVVNNNAEITEETVKAIEELKKYVDEYFDNLNIQEEVNNKLDEMAESGDLASIIAIFLDKSVATVTDGYTLTVEGDLGYNTQTGAYYTITTTVDHSHVQHEVTDGIYATVLDTAELNSADKRIAPMSAGLVSRLASCASTYINNKDDFVYGGNYSAFRPTVAPVGGKWEINCSTFAMLMAYGIRYENSAYQQGSGNNIIDDRFYEDKGMLDWFSTENEGQSGDYRWKYTYDLASYMYERGYCFEPNDDLSNVQPGDILFMKNQISGSEGVSTFREIDHSAIFGWWVSDNSYIVFEVGSKPSAQLYYKSTLEDNLVLVGRLATKPCAEDFQVVSYQQDAVTSNQGVLSYLRCQPFEENEYYTLICEITNTADIANVYPVIYQGATRLYGYDVATKKPAGNIYVMPFIPADLNSNIAIRMNVASAGITLPDSTLTNPRIVKGLMTKPESTVKPQRTLTVDNQQSGFSVSSISIHPGYAIVNITGALAQGNNYICDVGGLHHFGDILPCSGVTYTYDSGYTTSNIVYAVDFRQGTPRFVIKASSAITDATWVKHTLIVPLIQS